MGWGIKNGTGAPKFISLIWSREVFARALHDELSLREHDLFSSHSFPQSRAAPYRERRPTSSRTGDPYILLFRMLYASVTLDQIPCGYSADPLRIPMELEHTLGGSAGDLV